MLGSREHSVHRLSSSSLREELLAGKRFYPGPAGRNEERMLRRWGSFLPSQWQLSYLRFPIRCFSSSSMELNIQEHHNSDCHVHSWWRTLFFCLQKPEPIFNLAYFPSCLPRSRKWVCSMVTKPFNWMSLPGMQHSSLQKRISWSPGGEGVGKKTGVWLFF